MLLSACATVPPPGCVGIDQNGYYCLQPTSALKAFAAAQSIGVSTPQARQDLLVMLEIDRQGLRAAVLSPLGQKLMELHYDNHNVVAASLTGQTERFSPELAVALIQLALWPASSVRQGLSPSITLDEQDGRRRVETVGGTLLIVRYDGKTPPYRSLEIDWRPAEMMIQVRTLPVNAPGP
jgi:hypothetical protein